MQAIGSTAPKIYNVTRLAEVGIACGGGEMKRLAVFLLGLFFLTGAMLEAGAQGLQSPDHGSSGGKTIEQIFEPIKKLQPLLLPANGSEQESENRGPATSDWLSELLSAIASLALLFIFRIRRYLKSVITRYMTAAQQRAMDADREREAHRDYTSVDARIQEQLQQLRSGKPAPATAGRNDATRWRR